MGTHRVKRVGVPDGAGNTVKRTTRERQRHEGCIRAGKRGTDPEIPCSDKTELRVICRVTDNDNDPVSEAPAFHQPLPDKRGADPKALEVLVNSERGKGESGSFRSVRDNGDRREQDMPDDPVIRLSHE